MNYIKVKCMADSNTLKNNKQSFYISVCYHKFYAVQHKIFYITQYIYILYFRDTILLILKPLIKLN